MGTGQDLYVKARQIIPGGTQLLSKRPEMFLPDYWPAYYAKAKGVEIWDLDGNKYVDVSHCGVGAPILGYADPDVDDAVIKAIHAGTMATLNCPEEVELAELLIELHPWADMVRYSRTGGEILTIAVRIARASTGRDKVAFCGYHGWHDWYLAANLADDTTLDGHLLPGLEPLGVPRGLTGTTLPFHYNNIQELKTIIDQHGTDLAAIVMEPTLGTGPAEGFLEEVRAAATLNGTVLIFDEVTSGWRVNYGGIHLTYGVNPDMAAFGKATSNGYPMAAVLGTRAVMDAAQTSFISSSGWTEKIGPAAALATIHKLRRESVPDHLMAIGRQVQKGWNEAAKSTGLPVQVNGIPPLSNFTIQHDQSEELATLFNQEMLARGYLSSTRFWNLWPHHEEQIDHYLSAVQEVFGVMIQALKEEDVAGRLLGPVRHASFHRLS